MRRNPPLSHALVTALGLLLPMSASQAAELRSVQLQPQAGRLQAVVELSEAATFKVFSLAGPDRVVVDIAGTRADKGLRLPAPLGLVKGVRTGVTGDGGLRLVFDLQQPGKPQGRIEREAGRNRLTVDLGLAYAASPVPAAPANPPETSDINVFSVPEEELLREIGTPQARASKDLPAPQHGLVAATPLPASNPPPATMVVEAALAQATPPLPAAQPAASKALPANARTIQDVLGPGERELVIAIDPGHGGKDPGALGPTGKHEKQITLAVARELAKLIDADPGMRAVLIRDRDVFVPLQERYMKARAAQADLFISIHADAAQNHAAHGASVYVLSTRGASSQAARWLADKENAADLVGGISLDEKDKNLAAVLLDLSQSATMRMSEDMAGNVLQALKEVGKAHKPQVERANFVVLRSPDVPSMLVETGFITNADEERRLSDPEYRQKLAAAIASGVRDYFLRQPPPGTWYASRQGQPELAPTRDRQHVVGRGETLTHIAAVHGIPVSSLREANNKRDDVVRIGERLRIPALVASAPK
jgi:N-acetylmuramoyl-L-alanine amidase